MKTHTQVLVIGGGPAGATAASLLSKRGIEVTVFEKTQFPRYHIGESLLVSLQEILDLMGAREKLEECGFLRKAGALWDWNDEIWNFDWTKLKSKYRHGYQVKRSEFDHFLLQHAESLGSEVHFQVSVDAIIFDSSNPGRPVAAEWSKETADGQTEKGTITFDFLVDASGRTGIMCNKYLKCRRMNKMFENIAIWGYYKGVKKAQEVDCNLENPIVICSVPKGWAWIIPLHDGTTSIGVVLKHKYYMQVMKEKEVTREELYERSLKSSKLACQLMENAERVIDLKTEGDYSYSADQVCGDRFYVCGDAACFLDPLLSSGCHLAMYSATLAAASIYSTVKGTLTGEEAQDYYSQSYLRHYVRWLIIVSSLYINRSSDDYFSDAQQLVSQDITTLNSSARMSFTRMVSGMEDVSDNQLADSIKGLSERLSGKLHDTSMFEESVRILNGNIKKVEGESAEKHFEHLLDSAVNGVYMDRDLLLHKNAQTEKTE